ncbi:MAG: alkene reductase [Phycisphaerales bacterium]
MSSPLLTPYQLGPYLLTTRIVMAPMTRCRADADRAPHALNAEYYAQRADPVTGAALIVTEATQVCAEGVGYPGTPGIHTPAQVKGWRLVTDAVHRRGGLIYAQLWHVGRVSHSSFQPNGALPVSSSAVPMNSEVRTATYAKAQAETPRALEVAEIPGVVEQYRHGAQCAYDAGFDGVELHAANGYLVDQFLRDGVNRRTDRYGGSIENRLRFLREVVEALVKVWGTGRVGVRLSPTNAFNDMRDSDPAALFTAAATALNDYPLSYLHVLEGLPGSAFAPTNGAQPVAPLMRKAYRGAFIINAGYTQETGEAAVAFGAADLVAYGVPFIANPDLAERFRRGAALTPANPDTFYTPGAVGYTDYPALAARE